MKRIKVGFIGCGGHAGIHLYPSMEYAGLELIATCDIKEDKAREYARRFGAKNYYSDYKEMIAKEKLEAVLVSIGPEAHYRLGLDLLKSGYHVWMEKPSSSTGRQSMEMAEMAEKMRRVCQVGYNYRYTIAVENAMHAIRTGKFQKPSAVSVRWWLGDPNLTVFKDHFMCHAVDLLKYCSGGRLKDMKFMHRREDDNTFINALFESESGAMASLELYTHMPIQQHWSRIDWYSKSGIMSAIDFHELKWFHAEKWDSDTNFIEKSAGATSWLQPIIGGARMVLTRWGYVPELERFRKAVQGEISAESTIMDSAEAITLCDEMLEMINKRES